MSLNKKADISIGFVVAATIAIIIIVIVVSLLGRSGGNVNNVAGCVERGGSCIDNSIGCGNKQVLGSGEGLCSQTSICCSII